MGRVTKPGRIVVAAALIAAAKVASSGNRRSSGYRATLPWRIYNGVTAKLDRWFGWDRLPTPLGLGVLVGVRNILRQQNLHDTTSLASVDLPPIPPYDARFLTTRTADGTYNALESPRMGMARSRFGRNVPIDKTSPDPDPAASDPNPRVVSRELLTRAPFQPATTVNALAAAWLQFMIRDWFSHGRGDVDNVWTIRLDDDDDWPERPMQIPKTRRDPTQPADDDVPPTYLNTETHWWDGSSLYGSSPELQRLVRSGKDGKLKIRANGLLDLPNQPELDPTKVPGWWLGLTLMLTIFIREHNAICDRLREEYPSWSDEDIFQRARLITAALLAKIHTVEWTPAVISHPTTKIALRANWWGLVGERVHDLFGRISRDEVVSGIPGADPNHYGVPYSLTEEFVAVYRMHPLIPDDYSFRSAADDSAIPDAPTTLRELAGPKTKDVTDRIAMTDLLYSFGTIHPGLVVLHNFPRFLQEFERPDGHFQDLAATDILRSRELGVPRYNEFRRLLHLKPAASFSDLTDNDDWAAQIERVYGGDIERVDLTVGMGAEPLPAGFAFSDTAFRIFVLMASRRLNSDRFFTTDYTPRVYTQVGLDWIDDNDMTTVLVRHYPELATAMRGLDNAFEPWHRAVQ